MNQIDKNIPIPIRGRQDLGKWPYKFMEVGDSYAFPYEDGRKAQGYSATYAKKVGKKFMSRAVVENEIRVLRIWRIE